MFPLAVALIVFAVSNRDATPVDLWPFPATLEIPLFVLLFCALLAGVFWGGMATWISGGTARKAARIKVREARLAETEIRRLKEQVSKLEAEVKSRDGQLADSLNTGVLPAPKSAPGLPPPADAA